MASKNVLTLHSFWSYFRSKFVKIRRYSGGGGVLDQILDGDVASRFQKHTRSVNQFFENVYGSFQISTTDGCQVTFSKVLLILTTETRASENLRKKISARYLIWFRFYDQLNI